MKHELGMSQIVQDKIGHLGICHIKWERSVGRISYLNSIIVETDSTEVCDSQKFPILE